MKHKNEGKSLTRAAASLVIKAAQSNANAACFMLVHQPKEPSNMAARLKVMQKRDVERHS